MTYNDLVESHFPTDPNKPENRHITLDERSIHFPTMKPEEFRIEDVPHCLSMICRYNGFVRQFYSVAQHSVLVCELAEAQYGVGSIIAECALLHDASEAYLGDVSRPTKACLPDYKKLEAHVSSVIIQALQLPTTKTIWAEVSRFDVMALHIEANALLFHRYSWIKDPDPSWTRTRQGRRLIQAEQKGMLPAEAKAAMTAKLRDYGYTLPPDQIISHDQNHTNPCL